MKKIKLIIFDKIHYILGVIKGTKHRKDIMIKIKRKEGVKAPEFESELASGFDVTANSILTAYKGSTKVSKEKLRKMREGFEKRGYIRIRPFERILFGTGLVLADASPDIEIQVRARSGVALKKGVFVANQPGTIDSDFRGEMGIILYNSSTILARVDKGSRIAQFVPSKKVKVNIETSEEILVEATERGAGGFGSTGM